MRKLQQHQRLKRRWQQLLRSMLHQQHRQPHQELKSPNCAQQQLSRGLTQMRQMQRQRLRVQHLPAQPQGCRLQRCASPQQQLTRMLLRLKQQLLACNKARPDGT